MQSGLMCLKKYYQWVIIAILLVALIFSLYNNFKSPYLKEGKVEHLGKLTYQLPDSHWVYGDFVKGDKIRFPGKDGTYNVEYKDGRVFIKNYVDMETLYSLKVAYNRGIWFEPGTHEIKWSGKNGKVPKVVKNLRIQTNATKDSVGTYWGATFDVGSDHYVVYLNGHSDSYLDLSITGEEVIASLGYDDTLKDEYKK